MTELLEGTTPQGATTEEVAVAFGVTPQTVRNWQRRGMPCLADGKQGVSARFDLAACKRWAAANKMETGHGGERVGAGRKRRRGRPRKSQWRDGQGGPGGEPLIDEAEKRRKAIDLVAELAGREHTDPEALDLATDLCKLTYHNLVTLAHLTPEASGLTPSAIARLEKLLAVQQRQREFQKASGELVRASDVRREAEELYGELRQAMEAGAREWARELAAMLELDGEGHKRVERMLKDRVAAMVARVREIGQSAAEAA